MFNLNSLSQEEIKELFLLKEKIFGIDTFVEADFKNPDYVRYNDLILKASGFKHLMKNPT